MFPCSCGTSRACPFDRFIPRHDSSLTWRDAAAESAPATTEDSSLDASSTGGVRPRTKSGRKRSRGDASGPQGSGRGESLRRDVLQPALGEEPITNDTQPTGAPERRRRRIGSAVSASSSRTSKGQQSPNGDGTGGRSPSQRVTSSRAGALQRLGTHESLLGALTMELLIMGASVGSIRNTWSAIENRHRMFGYEPLLSEPGAIRRGIKALSSLRGQPSKLIFPLGRRHIKALLDLIGLTWTQRRNVLLVVTGTTMCARVSEPAGLRICNVFPSLDAPYDPQYQGGIGIKIVKRKNDTKRRGIMTRIPPGPFAERLLRWIQEEELTRHPRCTRESAPGARCRHCPPLFSKDGQAETRRRRRRPAYRGH